MSSSMTYGPSALRTPANFITVVRMLATPLMIAIVLHDRNSYVPAAMWLILALTDGADGFLARRQGATRSGAFLDPLADKVIVFGVLAALVYLGRIAFLPVGIMGVREIVISLYRSLLAKGGISVPARMLGKLKMVAQVVVVEMCLLPFTSTHVLAIDSVAWLATGLAVVSAGQYLRDTIRGPAQAI